MRASRPRILVVDDDAKIVTTMVRYLEHAGFEAIVAGDGIAALAAAREQHPDLLILDRMLPALDGLSVCRLLREESQVPVILLTARAEEHERLEGLHAGADDYVVKPFSPRELVARAQAVLRRAAPPPRRVLRVGELTIDGDQHEVQVRGAPVELTATELRLLAILAGAPGRVFTRSDLVTRLFGWSYEGTERGVDVHIKNLRRKIELDRERPEIIETVFGVGYRLAKPRSRPRDA